MGAIYELLALGFVIIYKSTQVLSFAQQGLTVLGAFWVVYFSSDLDLNFWVAVPLGLLLAAAVGIGVERLMVRPMVGKPEFSVAILTIGLNIVILVIAFDLIGVEIRSIGDPWGLKSVSFEVIVIVSHKNLETIITALVVVAELLAFFRYATVRAGHAMLRPVTQEVALAQGVKVTDVFADAVGAGSRTSSYCRRLPGSRDECSTFERDPGHHWALPAAVGGGLDSITGAIVGGFAIGLIEAYTAAYQGEYARVARGYISRESSPES